MSKQSLEGKLTSNKQPLKNIMDDCQNFFDTMSKEYSDFDTKLAANIKDEPQDDGSQKNSYTKESP